MALLPLARSLNGQELITTTCHLYRQSLLPALPVTFVMILIYQFIRFGHTYLPSSLARQKPLFIIALFLFLPLSAILFSIIDKVAKQQNFSYPQELFYFCKRLVALLGCLLSLLLLPGLLLGLGIAGYFFLGIKHMPSLLLYGWLAFTTLVIFMSFIPKIFAPLLLLLDQEDANSAIENSAVLTKGFFIRTFYQILYAVLLLVFLALLGHLIRFYAAHLGVKPLAWQIWEGVSELSLMFIISWSFTLILVHKYDLQLRKKAILAPVAPAAKIIIQSAKEASDKDKFNF